MSIATITGTDTGRITSFLAGYGLDLDTATPYGEGWQASVYATLRGVSHLMGRVLVLDATGVPFFEFAPWPGAGMTRIKRWDSMRAACGDDNATSRRSGYLYAA